MLLALAQSRGLLPEWLVNPVLASHGAVDARDAFIIHVQQPHRAKLVASDWLHAVAADDEHRAQVDQHQAST